MEARTTTVQQNTAMVRPPRGLPSPLTLACPPQLSLSLSLSLIDCVRKKKANAADWRNFMRGSHHVPKLTPGRPANKESTQQAFRCPKCGKAYKDRQGLEGEPRLWLCSRNTFVCLDGPHGTKFAMPKSVAITGVYECLVCKLCFRGGFNVDAIDKLPAVVKSEMFQV